MSSIGALKRELKALLGESYFYKQAPKNATYPYRVGLLSSSFDDEVAEVFTFELDYWGEKDEVLEDLVERDSGNGSRINPTGLNKRRILTDTVCAKIDREGVFDVNDPDTGIRHKRASYTIRLYY